MMHSRLFLSHPIQSLGRLGYKPSFSISLHQEKQILSTFLTTGGIRGALYILQKTTVPKLKPKCSPFFEIDKTWAAGENPVVEEKYTENHRKIGCRVFNTHLLHEMLPEGRMTFYMYIVRSGKDVVVSFYHHLKHQEEGGYAG